MYFSTFDRIVSELIQVPKMKTTVFSLHLLPKGTRLLGVHNMPSGYQQCNINSHKYWGAMPQATGLFLWLLNITSSRL